MSNSCVPFLTIFQFSSFAVVVRGACKHVIMVKMKVSLPIVCATVVVSFIPPQGYDFKLSLVNNC